MLPARIADHRDPGGIAELDRTDPAAAERLLGIVGDARVVAIGEGAHNIPEFTGFADRLFRLLARELGFTAFVKESGFAEGLLVDEWIGGGPGAVEEIARRGITYRFGESEPVRGQLAWMREQRLAGVPLHYYGADLPGSATSPGAAVRACLARIPGRPGDAEVLARSELGGRTEAARRLAGLDDPARRALFDALAAVARRGAAAADPIAQRAAASIAAFLAESAGSAAAGFPAGEPYPREAFLAETALWVLDREPKILVSAHNAHVRRTSLHGRPTMGSILAGRLGTGMRSIATTFGVGPEFVWEARSAHPFDVAVTLRERPLLPGSLDAVLEGARRDIAERAGDESDALLVDLRRAPRERFAEVAGVQAGSELDPLDDPAAAFDAVMHLGRVTAVPGAAERLNDEFARPEPSASREEEDPT